MSNPTGCVQFWVCETHEPGPWTAPHLRAGSGALCGAVVARDLRVATPRDRNPQYVCPACVSAAAIVEAVLLAKAGASDE